MPTRKIQKKGAARAGKTAKAAAATRKTPAPARKTPAPARRSTAKKGRLGRGLEALLGVSAEEISEESQTAASASKPAAKKPAARPASRSTGASQAGAGLLHIGTNQLVPSPFQPRRSFDAGELDELASSLREHGVLQPIVVRKGAGGAWQIVAGERRWRAAKLANIKKVPIVEKELSDSQAMSVALVENLQRVDLNPVEKARGIARLQNQCGLNHQQAASALGCSRTAITNLLRLLKLHPEILDMLSRGQLQAAHARPLLMVEGARQLLCAKKIVKEGMSSHAVEKMVNEILSPESRSRPRPAADPDRVRLERELADALGAKVAIKNTGRGGRIVISCKERESLEAIIDKLKRSS